MTAFISHSFDNKPEFDNIVDALVQIGVPFWNPTEVKPGSSLRDQLRQAVERCSVCIFVATHRAMGSSWCGAELGAFWGAGKPVIVYLALSTREALDLLSKKRFAAIISDMGRKEGPREGYVLLGAVRATDQKTPFFIYAGSNAAEHKREAMERGAQGSTNRAKELLDMVTEAL